ncbi:GNAT family N-acetyltransferase [Ruminococcaceae bacterium OttesenSCG-928-O06]|nr:GNAT family N-acetyltransferase [Ruminococcaceae bacterium OttesenSCG-928-O06]
MGYHLLKNGEELLVESARGQDAAEILQFLRIAAGESDYLLSTAEDFPKDVAAERAWLKNQAAQPNALALCGKLHGRVVAFANLVPPRQRRGAHTAELSLLVGKPLWGQGAGRAMMEALLRFAKDSGTLRLLHLGVRQDNTAAIALYESLGFARCGVLKGYFCVNGRYYDEVLMHLWLPEG